MSISSKIFSAASIDNFSDKLSAFSFSSIEGSVLSMGMYIGQSTKIVNRKTGEITYGKIPPYSVVVPGSLPDKNNSSAPSLYCAVIIKQVDEKTRSKTSVNELLRD